MRFLAFAAVALLASPAFAGATPWQDIAPGARLRLISSDVRAADGTTLVGIELDMPQSYKTYWRLPGETGIPTMLDISGSAGVAAPRIEWPYPTPEVTQGFLDYVYHGPTVLPVLLQPTGNSSVLQAAVTMGVCSEVCVPVRASFTLPLSFGAEDAGQAIRLRQAEALAPVPWDGPAPAFGTPAYDAGANALRLPLGDAAIDPASVIASTADPTVIFDAPQKSPDSRSILLPLRGQARNTDWTRAPVTLTFLTARGSFEVSAQVAAATP